MPILLYLLGMPDARSLTPLFEAIAHQDWDESRATALKIVEKERGKGNHRSAAKLRGALNGFGSNGSAANASRDDSGIFSISQALVRCPSGRSMEDIALRPGMRHELEEIVAEWNAAEELDAAGLGRRSRLLFHGPPGCGKTVTATAIADARGVPAYVVRFNALIGSYLGQTALNLREVFRFAAANQCVLVLDEIDVLGKKRGSQMDVGELDRIVVGLMQELDLTKPKGLIVGASNLSTHLDEALWRRFDLQMKFPAPTKAEILKHATKLAKAHNVRMSAAIKDRLAKIKDYATSEKVVVDQARRAFLKKLPNHGQ